MSATRDRVLRWLENRGGIVTWVAGRGSRNSTWLDRVCRRMVDVVLTPPGEDFMRDPLIDDHPGFDADELDRYQRGESVSSIRGDGSP